MKDPLDIQHNKVTVIVTGAGGYIGSIISYMLLDEGFRVLALDNFSHGFREPLEILRQQFGPQQLKVYETDLLTIDPHILQSEKSICAILHFAALCDASDSIKYPQKYFNNNVNCTLNLLEVAIHCKIKCIIFSSTCAVYGEPQYLPVDEMHPISPLTMYAQSKLLAEKLIEWYATQHDLKYVIFRYFNVVGASQDGKLGSSKKPSTQLIENAIKDILGLSKFYRSYADTATPDRSPIRDFINVIDLGRAHIQAMSYLDMKNKNQIVNLGSGYGLSVKDSLSQIEKVTGRKIKYREATKKRNKETSQIVASIEKAKKILDWQPQHTFTESIKSSISWYKHRPQGWNY